MSNHWTCDRCKAAYSEDDRPNYQCRVCYRARPGYDGTEKIVTVLTVMILMVFSVALFVNALGRIV